MVKTRSFHGDLSLLSAVNLFQLIGLAALTGYLKMSSAKNSIHFIFSEGKFNYAFSLDGHKKIGQRLLDAQLLTREQLTSCLAYQKAAEKWQKLGVIAVKNGYLQPAQLTDLFFSQLKSAFFEAITWVEGNFTFIDTSPLSSEDIILMENIDSLIMQGLVLMDEAKLETPLKH